MNCDCEEPPKVGQGFVWEQLRTWRHTQAVLLEH